MLDDNRGVDDTSRGWGGRGVRVTSHQRCVKVLLRPSLGAHYVNSIVLQPS